MAKISRNRTMTNSLLGPTAGEMREFLEGIDDNTRLRVDKDNGYNQMDPGYLTFSVTETPSNKSKSSNVGVTAWRDQ